MTRSLIALFLLSLFIAPALYAFEPQNNSNRSVQGMVLSVHRQKLSFPGDGLTTPTDAPLSSSYYAFDVAIRVDCKTYVGRYQSAFDYLPSEFDANQAIRVRLTKHIMYFSLANNPGVRLGIVHRSSAASTSCTQNP